MANKLVNIADVILAKSERAKKVNVLKSILLKVDWRQKHLSKMRQTWHGMINKNLRYAERMLLD